MKNTALAQIFILTLALSVIFSGNIFSHCDTMDGPVINDAKEALEKANADIVIKWVREQDEARLRKAFDETLKKREQNPQDKDIIDMSFYEETVKLHRAGEGVEYTGIKSGQIQINPIIEIADEAIAKEDIVGLLKLFPEDTKKEVQGRFDKVMEKKRQMNKSVSAGREYVASYIEFMHCVEELYNEANNGKEKHHQHFRH